MINVSLGGFLLLFVASRLLYLLLIDPRYLSPQLGDELYVGTIAKELVTGLTMPFAEYRTNNYMLGTLVMGALASGFFRLFGPTQFALKLAPLFLSTLALVFRYWTIQRAAGERVARYFAVLFCVSPPLFTTYSVATPCCHSESILFSALTVFLLFRMLSQEKPSLAYSLLIGLTAGFGLWFDYIYGLTLLATLGFWLWYNKGKFWRAHVLWYSLGFVVGFSPWILFNVQNHFAGLVIDYKSVWEHLGLAHLWDGLAHPRTLAPIEFLRTIASDDSRDLYRRAVNLLYSVLYLGPILTAAVLHLKSVRSEPPGVNDRGRGPRETHPSRTHPTQPTLVGFGILYLVVFTLAVQFSDFRAARYNMPAYPFLFFFVAHSLARCQDAFPLAQRKIQIFFLASVVVFGLGTHAPLLSLDRPGYALHAKGYAYAILALQYLYTRAPVDSADRAFIPELLERPFFSDILPKLSSDDQRELSRGIAWMLAFPAPLNGQAEDFARLERLVPAGLDKLFYYAVGVRAISRSPNELPKAVAAVEFLRHRSAAAHHLALIGTYRAWAESAPLDSNPETLANAPVVMAPELSSHYWRAIGHLAGRYWYDTDRSLSLFNARVDSFMPRLEPSVQRSVLQGIGQALFTYPNTAKWLPPAQLERFPQAYQEGVFEGWGMALGEFELFSPFPWKGQEIPYWTAWTKGLSARSLSYVQQGKAQFDAIFEGPAPRPLEPPRQAR